MGSSVELVFVVDPPWDKALEDSWKAAVKNLRVQWIFNVRRRGRGASVLQGYLAAKGHFCITTSADCAVPLGDILKIFQTYLDKSSSGSAPAVFLGCRANPEKAKKVFRRTKGSLQNFFENVENERLRALQLQDPTSPVLGLSRETLSQLAVTKVPSWFYASAFTLAARKMNFPIFEVPVNCQDSQDSRFLTTWLRFPWLRSKSPS